MRGARDLGSGGHSHARLYEETQERLRHTETLLAVSQDAGSTLDLTEILRRTTRAMVRALGADIGGAWLTSEDGSRFVPIVGYHVPKELLGALESASLKSLDPRVSDWRRVEGPRVLQPQPREDPRFTHPIARLVPHKSVLIQPMRWKGTTIGGFAIAWLRSTHRFTSRSCGWRRASRCRGWRQRELAPVRGVKQQMAELKRTQAQLIQSDQARRDRRAGGEHRPRDQQPAHERARLRLVLAEQAPAVDPRREELDLIQEEAGRARDIVRDLLHFSRQREFIPQITDLNAVLEQTLGMVRRQGALDSITLHEDYARASRRWRSTCRASSRSS